MWVSVLDCNKKEVLFNLTDVSLVRNLKPSKDAPLINELLVTMKSGAIAVLPMTVDEFKQKLGIEVTLQLSYQRD